MRIPPHAKYEIIYEMTKQNGNRLSVSTLCEIAGVSRSGYYNYLSTEDVRLKREEQDRYLRENSISIALPEYTH